MTRTRTHGSQRHILPVMLNAVKHLSLWSVEILRFAQNDIWGRIKCVTKALPRTADLMRALILILLGMLTFILGARLIEQRNGVAGESASAAACSACPLAQECGKAVQGEQGK